MSAIVEKIAKLDAKARSAADLGNRAEALVFSRKVERLLREYDLTIEDVRRDAEREDEVKVRLVPPTEWGEEPREEPPPPWAVHLASVVAAYHECLVGAYGRTNGIVFVGVVDRRDAAVDMFVRLALRVREMAERAMTASKPEPVSRNEYPSGVVVYYGSNDTTSATSGTWGTWGAPSRPKDELWRMSYLCGASQSIGEILGERLRRERRTATERAVVPVGHRSKLRDWVDANTAEPEEGEAPVREAEPPKPIEIRRDGFAAGAEAAKSLNLDALELTA